MYKNIMLSADSYKYSQFNQYPPNTKIVHSFIESRGGKYKDIVFFGLQAFLREYLTKPITLEEINLAEKIILAHGEPFNRKGWEYIVKNHNGKLPVMIASIDEGTVTSPHIPLVTVTNTGNEETAFITSFLETALLRAIWYPTTVASNSFASRKVIQEFLASTGDLSGLNFKLHDFGARGVSSIESAGLGGLAHLAVGFQGTDTVTALLAANAYYDEPMAGFSIPAMEHSTVTSWGRDNEVEAYRNMLKQYGSKGAIFAAVSDSYNIYDACEHLWGEELKDEVIASGATVVIRPDSGDPKEVNLKVISILGNKFGYTRNEKGYKVLNNVRLIQGDGITTETIRAILTAFEQDGWSADNIAFGQGGALLQQVNRDTCKFAMKCSAIYVDGEWRDVYKEPVDDTTKHSKRGIQTTSDMKIRFYNGELHNETNLFKVRMNVAKHL